MAFDSELIAAMGNPERANAWQKAREVAVYHERTLEELYASKEREQELWNEVAWKNGHAARVVGMVMAFNRRARTIKSAVAINLALQVIVLWAMLLERL